MEDDSADLKLVTGHLQNEPYSLLTARNGAEALELACRRRPDLILLDILLPDLDGFQLAARIKAQDATRVLQIIMMTALNDPDSRIKGLETGGDDFLVKPINPRELRTRVKTLLRKKRYLDRLRTQYNLAVHSALTDGLTGLYNHSYFKDFLDLELKRASRSNYPLSLMMIDINDFKQINDRLGHAAGDRILGELAGVLKKTVGEIDLAARYGGEEFAVVLPYAAYDAALQAAKKLQARIRAWRFFHDKEAGLDNLAVSMGLAFSPIDSEFSDSLLRTADERLYRAKKAGKNRICTANPETTQNIPAASP